MRQKIAVIIADSLVWHAEDIRSFPRAIHEHPTITSFVDYRSTIPYGPLDAMYSALVTLPSLESIGLQQRMTGAESALDHPDSLTELLRLPSLRNFTPALCQATANALMEGTAITKLQFIHCSFSAGESGDMLANGLSRNTSVSSIKVVSPLDQAIVDALATSLSLNSTLRRLDLRWQHREHDYDWS